MKKLISIFLVLTVSTLCFAGCIGVGFATPEEKAKQQSSQIIKCFENKDKDRLKSMFCKTVSDKCNLDEEIQEAFDFINGEIVSYDEPHGISGGASFEDGERIRQSLRGHISYIKTDTDKTYNLRFHSYLIFKANKNNVGVTNISLILQNDKVYDIGEFIE